MRIAEISRKTGETDIQVKCNLDGNGSAKVSTGIGFFDHMLDLFTKHGLFDMEIFSQGDLVVDGHHTVEDVGIALGQAVLKAVGSMELLLCQWMKRLPWCHLTLVAEHF